MAAPVTLRFGDGYIEAGDGATPTEVFTKVCGFTEIQLTFEKELNETVVPDCDDPDAPAWTQRDAVSQSMSFSCSGVAAVDALPALQGMFADGASRNLRIRFVGGGSGGATPDRLISGKFHTKYSLSGQRGERWRVEFSGESDGAVTNTAVAAV